MTSRDPGAGRQDERFEIARKWIVDVGNAVHQVGTDMVEAARDLRQSQKSERRARLLLIGANLEELENVLTDLRTCLSDLAQEVGDDTGGGGGDGSQEVG